MPKALTQLTKNQKLIIAAVAISILAIVGLIMTMILTWPFTPAYKLVPLANHNQEYVINPANSLNFARIEMQESILRLGVPQELEVVLNYQGNRVGATKVDLSRIKSGLDKPSFKVDFSEFNPTPDDQNIEVKLMNPTSQQVYDAFKLPFKIDATLPNLVSIKPERGGAMINKPDIIVSTQINDAQNTTVEFDEPIMMQDANQYSTSAQFKLRAFNEGETQQVFDYAGQDYAGNSISGRFVYRLDNTAPAIKLISSNQVNIGSGSSSTRSLSFSTNEPLQSISYKDNQGRLLPRKTDQYTIGGFVMVPGVNTYEVIAKDLAGNQAKLTVRINVVRSTSTSTTSGLRKCNISDTQYCAQRVGGNPCNNPSAYIACKKARCSGTTTVTCGGKVYR